MWQNCGRLSWKTDDEHFTFATLSAVWNMPVNSVGWAQHAAHCSKICAKAAEQWSKGTLTHCIPVCNELDEQGKKDANFISTIITGDECRCLGTTLRRNSGRLSGRLLFHQDGRWMENSIATFWGDWGKTSGANVQTSGATTPGPCIMTTLRLTRRLLCSSFRTSMTTVIPHPPYSPDLAPCDYFLFLKMKLKLKGWHFDSSEEIQTESEDMIKSLMRNDFQQCFRSWKSHWDRCINAEGNYFEGNGGKYNFRSVVKLWQRNCGNFWVAPRTWGVSKTDHQVAKIRY